jgi:hypothetical protein
LADTSRPTTKTQQGGQSPRRAENQTFFVIFLPEIANARDDNVYAPLCLVEVFTRETIVHLPASVFLEALRLRSGQSFAGAGTDAVFPIQLRRHE